MFFKPVNLLIASRYIKSKNKENFVTVISWFAFIGILLGSATLVIVMSVMNGFREDITSKIIGFDGHIGVRFYNKDKDYFINKINSSNLLKEHITYINPIIYREVLASTKGGFLGARVKSLTLKNIEKNSKLSTSINWLNQEGKESYINNKTSVLIGSDMASRLAIKLGGEITLISQDGTSTVMGYIPRFGRFKVVGIFNTGMYTYDSTTVLMPLKMGELFFKQKVRRLEVFTNKPDDVEIFQEEIANLTQNDDIYLSNWKSNNYMLMNALNVEKNVMFLILSLIIIIASFNIISGLIILVKSKTKEIGLMRSLGFSNSDIRNIFFYIGIRIGVLGSGLGCLVGTIISINLPVIQRYIEAIFHISLFSKEVYFLSQLPSHFDILQMLVVFGMSVIFSIIASLYPALKATKVNPVQALHYE